MQIYRTHSIHNPEHTADYWGTLAEAHDHVKGHLPGARPDYRIDLFDVDTSKAGIISLCQARHEEIFSEDNVKRTWEVTARGGLHEVKPGD